MVALTLLAVVADFDGHDDVQVEFLEFVTLWFDVDFLVCLDCVAEKCLATAADCNEDCSSLSQQLRLGRIACSQL